MKTNFYAKGILGMIAASAAAYALVIRPWHLGWGSTEEEQKMQIDGDEIKPDAGNIVTHAITINAPPENIWPYLVQIGQGRGGFYSYDTLENLFGLDIHNLYDIRPELQGLKEGDFVRSAHKGWLGGKIDDKAGWFVVKMVPDRSLVLRDEIERGSWAFSLTPLPNGNTRLIVRVRGDRPQSVSGWLVHLGVFEPAHFIMERKMMLTLKAVAERDHTKQPMLANAAAG